MSEKPNIPQTIGPYNIKHSIGDGAFSTVYDATYKDSPYQVAIKIIKKPSFPPDKLIRELTMMQSLDYPFAVSFFQFLQDSENSYFVMEKIQNGSLLNLLNRYGSLSEWQIRHYFCQLISALDYLHNVLKIAHRDIKLENIMIDRCNNIRLIDFGLGNIFRGENVVLQTACGSPAYAPPEMLTGKTYTTSADIWSAGIVLYAMTYGRLPFDDKNIQRLVTKIVLEEPKYERYDSVLVPEDLSDLIHRLLNKDMNTRITLPEIMDHPWFKKYPLASEMNLNFGPRILPHPNNVLYSNRQKLTISGYDLDTLEEMKNDFGIATEMVEASLLKKEFNDATALYKIIRREKITSSFAMPKRIESETRSEDSSQNNLNEMKNRNNDLRPLQFKCTKKLPTRSPGNSKQVQPLSMSLKLTKMSQNVRSHNPHQINGSSIPAAYAAMVRHNQNVAATNTNYITNPIVGHAQFQDLPRRQRALSNCNPIPLRLEKLPSL